MIKFFYSIQTCIEKTKLSLVSKVSYRVFLILLRLLLPIYYKVTATTKTGVSDLNPAKNKKVIVSLTTFPARIENLWIVIESLLRQNQKPDKIILWLADSQFKSQDSLPKKILKLKERGVEIRFCADLKSHKKYYYSMLEYPDDIIITVDDDLFYPENMIEQLMNKHAMYPKDIVCYRAHEITFNNSVVEEYSKWNLSSRNISGPSFLLMATNGAGALYPPNCLDPEVFNIEVMQKICLNADDIWLKCMGILKSTYTVKVYKNHSEFFSTRGSSETGLARENVTQGLNDIQLNLVMKKYRINLNDFK